MLADSWYRLFFQEAFIVRRQESKQEEEKLIGGWGVGNGTITEEKDFFIMFLNCLLFKYQLSNRAVSIL